MNRRQRASIVIAAITTLGACSGGGAASNDTRVAALPPGTQPPPLLTTEAPVPVALQAGAASRSILPTVTDGRAYVSKAPGWTRPDATTPFDPDDPGVYVPLWDQGSVDIGNGSSDAAWVHDDLRVSALALEFDGEQVILVSADVYMVFSADGDEIARRAHNALPLAWSEAPVLIAATHNHHGPDTAFSVNDEWYELFAVEAVGAVVDAVDALEPATIATATGEHRFGVNDARDPVVLDPSLRLMTVTRAGTDETIANVVQWTSHPETTLGWNPPEVANLEAICTQQNWADDDCTAEGRYLTADYPGVMREYLQRELGGEVLYFNGPLGSQIGPGQAPTWVVDDEHPIGNGWTVPKNAFPLALCDSPDLYLCQSFAKTDAIGAELAKAVVELSTRVQPNVVDRVRVRRENFYTRLTNIGFRVLLADGDLGWRDEMLYNCAADSLGVTIFDDDSCVSDEGATEDDPVLTPLTGSQIRRGDVLQSRLVHLSLGDVGFLFLPGELPPELVVGLPVDFDRSPEKYYRDPPDQHAFGADYEFPGYLLSLVDEPITFTIGLGTDELGYWVPVSDYRLTCLDAILPEGTTCRELFNDGHIDYADAIAGSTCRRITDNPQELATLPPPADAAVVAVCRYGQAIGRELGEPEGHYEETNAAGWGLVDDLWAAATRLFGRETRGRINPDNPGYTPEFPPPG